MGLKISPHGSKLLLIGWINNFDYAAEFETEEQRFWNVNEKKTAVV